MTSSFPPHVPPPPKGPKRTPPPQPMPPGPRIARFQIHLSLTLMVAMVTSISLWHFTTGIEYTGILFIGIPGTIAALLALEPRRHRGKYHIVTGTMIVVFASSIVLREGFICVLMALPIILPTAMVVAHYNQKSHDQRQGPRDVRRAAWILPVLLLGAAGDGTVYELPKNVTVAETRAFDTTSHELSASLHDEAEIPDIEPLLFALPFPKPTAFTGTGADVGDIRTVDFGDDGEMGALILEVTDRSDQHITWTIVDNTTPVAEWMTLHQAEASWAETADGLEVTMEIEFDRELAPAFYFDPLERWGVGEMAEVLLDMLAHNAPTTSEA